jgi:hypothetical protein
VAKVWSSDHVHQRRNLLLLLLLLLLQHYNPG